MREIKFRAKIKGDAGVYRVWAIDWLNARALIERACGDEWVDFSKLEPFMQFTGLEDMKGVEIYEGDILREDASENPGIGVVEWKGGALGFSYTKWLGKIFCRETMDCFEVVGNIYANPELVKVD